MSPIHLFPHLEIRLSPSLAGGWWCPANSFVSTSNNSFVSQSGGGSWCPALPMSPCHLFPRLAVHIYLPFWLVVSGFPDAPNTNSFISSPRNSFVCLPLWLVVGGVRPIHLFPHLTIHLFHSLAVTGGVRLSRCLHVICFPI